VTYRRTSRLAEAALEQDPFAAVADLALDFLEAEEVVDR
jgi:hypothetical protein